MGSGWAYVDCSDSGGSGSGSAGPAGSLQFMTASTAGAHTSGSDFLIFKSASNTLFLTGTLVVSGNISASSYTIKNVQEIDGTGSTFFGDTYDDLHARTGSLEVFDALVAYPFVKAEPRRAGASGNRALVLQSASFMPHYSASGQGATTITANGNAHILGIQSTGNVSLVLSNPAAYAGCKVMVVKDEVLYRTGSITITATGGGTIDGETSYILSGTMPAVNLYTNGTSWFVY